MNHNNSIPSSPLEHRAEYFKTIGVAALVLGFIGASIIYFGGEKLFATNSHQEIAPAESSWKDGTLAPDDLKGSSRTIEMNYGKIAVLLLNWLHRWDDLKPHQFLAIAIAAVATLIAIYCFLTAKRLLRDQIEP